VLSRALRSVRNRRRSWRVSFSLILTVRKVRLASAFLRYPRRRSDPSLKDDGDAIIRITRAAICGSDLWFYRGVPNPGSGSRTGHEFVGILEDVGRGIRALRAGDVVIAPFAWSDGTCEFCREGLQPSCVHVGFFGGEEKNGGQAELIRVPYADGTLVKVSVAISLKCGQCKNEALRNWPLRP
jgi:threonine dehydrogenase-like Zn-dependent dehydrogenase